MLVASDDEGAEAEATAAFDDLRATVDMNHLLDGVAGAAGVTLRGSSDLSDDFLDGNFDFFGGGGCFFSGHTVR